MGRRDKSADATAAIMGLSKRMVKFHLDNARAELIHRRGPWRSLKAVEFATPTCVDWFNNRRLLEPVGNIPPAEAEERHYAMLDERAMAA